MNTGLVGGITTVPSSRFSKEVDIHTSTPIDVFSEMLRDLQSIHPGLKIDDAGIATTDTSEKYNVYYIIRREQRYGSLGTVTICRSCI